MRQKDTKPKLKTPLFILAPMDDVTDTVFRQVVSSCAPPDYCFSEFVNVDGLAGPGRSRLLRKLERGDNEPPLVAHIWGLDPNNFRLIADQIASGDLARELGLKNNYVGIDLNMGCPARAVVKNGACSGLINNPDLAAEIISAAKEGADGRLPVSVKTRLGFNSINPEWTRFLLAQDVSMLTVHLRTVKEMSKVEAHYEEIERLKRERDELAPKTLLVVNGDILNRQQGEELVKRYGVDGVMIGRGIFHDPFAFSPKSPWQSLDVAEKLSLFEEHLSLYQKWAEDPDRGVSRLNKYAKIYVNGFDGAKELREKLATKTSLLQMLQVIQSFPK